VMAPHSGWQIPSAWAGGGGAWSRRSM